jgi:hypothetical protein
MMIAIAAAALGLALASPAGVGSGAGATALAVQPPMVGGFRDIDTARADVQEAAQFAAGELGIELAAIDSAQSKSVGAYLFLLELSAGDGTRWRVQVTKPLRGGTWALQNSEQIEDLGE